MPICQLCGEDKIKKQFVKIKHFDKIHPEPVIWCRDCMKMYEKKLKIEARTKALQEMKPSFFVVFS
jgi:hypothetical protein